MGNDEAVPTEVTDRDLVHGMLPFIADIAVAVLAVDVPDGWGLTIGVDREDGPHAVLTSGDVDMLIWPDPDGWSRDDTTYPTLDAAVAALTTEGTHHGDDTDRW